MISNIECPGRDAYFAGLVSAVDSAGDIGALQGKTVLITGATGLVGGALVRALLIKNRMDGAGIKLLCPVRSLSRAKSVLEGVFDRKELNVFEADIADFCDIPGPIDFIIHAASPTKSSFFVSHPAQTVRAMTGGTMNMLDLAREKQVQGMVYVSSMEAFGAVYDEAPRSEKELGYIDLESARSSYSEGKRMCELMCTCWAKEYGVNVRSVRLAQTFGAGVNPDESRVFMQFAKAALDGKDLVLHTKGRSFGNYLSVSDCVSAILTLLVKGENGVSYTACGDNCRLTIKELAEKTALLLSGGKSKAVIDIPEDAAKLGYAPDTKLNLDSSRLKALGWTPRFGIDDMIYSLAQDIKGRRQL